MSFEDSPPFLALRFTLSNLNLEAPTIKTRPMLYFYVASPEAMKGGVDPDTFDASRLYRSLDLARGDERGQIYVVDARRIPATLSGDVSGIPKDAILNRKPYRRPKGMTAGGGVITKWGKTKLKVLLIYRKGRWDIAKGGQDKGESIEACARREVMEEIGIDQVAVHGFLDTTVHGYPEKGRFIVKTTHWYHMTTDAKKFVPQESERITKVKWFSLQKAKESLGHENLIRLLNRIEHKLLITHP